MPVPFDATTIKSWFQTGDKPAQQQYHDWIDTMFHMLADLQTQITDLEASVAAISGLASVYVAVEAIGVPAFTGGKGVDTITSISTQAVNDVVNGTVARNFRTLRITFDPQFLNTDYTVVAWTSTARMRSNVGSFPSNPLSCPLPPVQIDKQETHIDIEVQTGAILYLICYP